MILNTFNKYVNNKISEVSYVSHLIYTLKLLSLNIEGYKIELNHIEQELKKNNRMLREYMSVRICMLEEKLLNIEKLTLRNYDTRLVDREIISKQEDCDSDKYVISVKNILRSNLLSSCSDQRKRLDKLKCTIYYSQLSVNFILAIHKSFYYIAELCLGLKIPMDDMGIIYFSELLNDTFY